jgi:hypothetical protein
LAILSLQLNWKFDFIWSINRFGIKISSNT